VTKLEERRDLDKIAIGFIAGWSDDQKSDFSIDRNLYTIVEFFPVICPAIHIEPG